MLNINKQKKTQKKTNRKCAHESTVSQHVSRLKASLTGASVFSPTGAGR